MQEGHECTEMSPAKNYKDAEDHGASELHREGWRAGLFSLEKRNLRGIFSMYTCKESKEDEAKPLSVVSRDKSRVSESKLKWGIKYKKKKLLFKYCNKSPAKTEIPTLGNSFSNFIRPLTCLKFLFS